jgi:hypothetical protein
MTHTNESFAEQARARPPGLFFVLRNVLVCGGANAKEPRAHQPYIHL